MDELLPDTWHTRERPTLLEAARLLEEAAPGQGAPFASLRERTGLDDADLFRALKALELEGLIEVGWTMPAHGARVKRISGDARRLVGLWPTPESAFDRMIMALEAIAEHGDNTDERSRARKILEGLSGAGKSIGISVATTMVTGQLPGQ